MCEGRGGGGEKKKKVVSFMRALILAQALVLITTAHPQMVLQKMQVPFPNPKQEHAQVSNTVSTAVQKSASACLNGKP